MGLRNFRDWLDAQQESSAFTRRRDAAAKGLAPPIPDASLHSRSTASPFETDQQKKKSKKKKRKKKKVDEGRNPADLSGIDDFVREIEGLKSDKETSDKTPKKKPTRKKRCIPKNRSKS